MQPHASDTQLEPRPDRTDPRLDDQPLAERGTRLVARGIDGALAMIAAMPALYWLLPAVTKTIEEGAVPWGEVITSGVVASVLVLAFSIYQWWLIATSGQSIGKRLTHIRIVKLDGRAVGFVDAVVLREWVMGLILTVASVVVAWIPVLGPGASFVLSLADYVPIFAIDRRCLHDHLAGTKVVAVPVAPRA